MPTRSKMVRSLARASSDVEMGAALPSLPWPVVNSATGESAGFGLVGAAALTSPVRPSGAAESRDGVVSPANDWRRLLLVRPAANSVGGGKMRVRNRKRVEAAMAHIFAC